MSASRIGFAALLTESLVARSSAGIGMWCGEHFCEKSDFGHEFMACITVKGFQHSGSCPGNPPSRGRTRGSNAEFGSKRLEPDTRATPPSPEAVKCTRRYPSTLQQSDTNLDFST
eukprot:5317193-Pyramimonas_sp.AAC.1